MEIDDPLIVELPFPAQSFFSRMYGGLFMRVLEEFSKGNGFGFDGSVCSLPVNLAEEEGGLPSDYAYIEFWTVSKNETARLPIAEFLNTLAAVAASYAIEHPKLSTEIDSRVAQTAQALAPKSAD